MRNKNYYPLLALLSTCLLMGCDNELDNIEQIDVPEGYELSAGTSTVFNNSSFAYDQDASWVADNSANRKRFTHGDKLYDDALT
ncbi:MAG: thiol oxidoreductase, partial [Bacteroidaceae bacterium]|nr:thiol oxidoreductase [Bacteroidaceae bacterium]